MTNKRKTRPALMLLRVLSVLLLVGPPVGVAVAWGWMALSGLSPNRRAIFEQGEGIILAMMGLGVLGLIAEFVILPILLNDGATGRSDGGG